MTRITFGDGKLEVEASLIASALDLTPDDLRAAMRAGRITTRVERGEDQDAGRWRLTFFATGRRLRLVVDNEGRVLTTSLADHVRRGVADGGVADGGAADCGAADGGAADGGPDGSSDKDGS